MFKALASLDTAEADNPAAHFVCDRGWVRVLPHEHDMDSFFMVKFQKT